MLSGNVDIMPSQMFPWQALIYRPDGKRDPGRPQARYKDQTIAERVSGRSKRIGRNSWRDEGWWRLDLVKERRVGWVKAERDYINDENKTESENKFDQNGDREYEQMKDVEGCRMLEDRRAGEWCDMMKTEMMTGFKPGHWAKWMRIGKTCRGSGKETMQFNWLFWQGVFLNFFWNMLLYSVTHTNISRERAICIFSLEE